MAYSRWTNSFWYCFHAKQYSPNWPDDMEHQVFEIVREEETKIFFYPQLKNARSQYLSKIKAEFNANEEQLEELNIYIDKFIQDVESEFCYK